MLATLRHYTKRPKYIVEALADLVELYQDQLIQNVGTVIKVNIMQLHRVPCYHWICKTLKQLLGSCYS